MSSSKPKQSILAIAFNGEGMEGIVLHRSNGSLRVEKAFRAPLNLNLSSDAIELIGQEIRQHLDHEGIEQKHCVVCLPPQWAMSLQTKIPQNLPEADLAGFLEIEAERGFPYPVDVMSLATLQFRSPNGGQFANLVGIPRQNLTRFEASLRAAQLRPVSFTLAITALHRAVDGDAGALTILLGQNHVDLLVSTGPNIAAVRSMQEPIEIQSGHRHLDLPLLLREIKVTFGQLPAELAGTIRQAIVIGQGEIADSYADQLVTQLRLVGLDAQWAKFPSALPAMKPLPPDVPFTPAAALARNYLKGERITPEFLPPRVSSWKRASNRFASKKLASVGLAALFLVLCVGAALFFQHWKLRRLETEWAAIEPRVHELEEMQQRIKRFRPWFDESFPSLTLLRRVTEAFPEEGVVTAKTLEIRDRSSVNCTGLAEDSQAFLQMLDRLRSAREVKNLNVDLMKGRPLQFSFNFQWNAGGADEH